MGYFYHIYRVSIIWNLKTISYIEGFGMLIQSSMIVGLFSGITLAVAIPGALQGLLNVLLMPLLRL
jgi:hypothetical protein